MLFVLPRWIPTARSEPGFPPILTPFHFRSSCLRLQLPPGTPITSCSKSQPPPLPFLLPHSQMETISPAPLFEEQLDLTLRLLLEYSASMSCEELKSLCQRLTHMHHTLGHILTLKTLESEGVAPLGSYDLCLSQLSRPTSLCSTDYLNLLDVDATPSSVGGSSGLRTVPTDASGNANAPTSHPHLDGIHCDHGRGSTPSRRNVPVHRGRGSAPMRRGRGRNTARVNRHTNPQGTF